MTNINLTLLTDFYEITMGNGYFVSGFSNKIAYFDMYFREIPDDGGFAIMAGVEQLIDYIKNLRFNKTEINYLRSKKMFSEEFLTYLQNFKFSCDIWAVPEGTPIFPNEPLLIVRGPVIEAQFIETMLLVIINHQCLIATKANRIARAAQGRAVIEFGARRAHGPESAIDGARAAFIGGCVGTSCTIAGKKYDIPALGTMAHSWIQVFPSELEAFQAYARTYPDNCTLLVDTYNVLKSGVPNAIRVFKEELVPRGFRPAGIRIDSGDITYLSKESRKMLDEAGFSDCKIMASNALDEHIIKEMLQQDAKVDAFGVGERLITAKSDPVFGGIYKLVAMEESGEIIPKIKLSENVTKITNPGFKQVWRFFDRKTGKAIADVITSHDEIIDESKPFVLFDPDFTWKRKSLKDFHAYRLLIKIFDKGTCIYQSPSLQNIQNYCSQQLETLWDEVKRFENPHKYYVDLSKALWEIKEPLLYKFSSLPSQEE